MPRPLREDFEGAVQHVFARGNRRAPLFLDDHDYEHYLALLGGVAKAKRWRVLAYCLMPNHVHLVVETPEANLARGMQYLHGFYANDFNARHGEVGHAFQGRYGSKPFRDDIQLITAIRYVALNPFDASLCARPEDWKWNSYGRVLAGDAPAWLDQERLFGYVELWSRDGRRGYEELVSSVLGELV